jgi:hypothetical protein
MNIFSNRVKEKSEAFEQGTTLGRKFGRGWAQDACIQDKNAVATGAISASGQEIERRLDHSPHRWLRYLLGIDKKGLPHVELIGYRDIDSVTMKTYTTSFQN